MSLSCPTIGTMGCTSKHIEHVQHLHILLLDIPLINGQRVCPKVPGVLRVLERAKGLCERGCDAVLQTVHVDLLAIDGLTPTVRDGIVAHEVLVGADKHAFLVAEAGDNEVCFECVALYWVQAY